MHSIRYSVEISNLAAFDATFKLRNAIYDIIGIVSPSGPGDAMTLMLFYVFMAFETAATERSLPCVEQMIVNSCR